MNLFSLLWFNLCVYSKMLFRTCSSVARSLCFTVPASFSGTICIEHSHNNVIVKPNIVYGVFATVNVLGIIANDAVNSPTRVIHRIWSVWISVSDIQIQTRLLAQYYYVSIFGHGWFGPLHCGALVQTPFSEATECKILPSREFCKFWGSCVSRVIGAYN